MPELRGPLKIPTNPDRVFCVEYACKNTCYLYGLEVICAYTKSKGAIEMQEKDFESAVNEFVEVRINAYEFDENDAVTEALREFYSHLERVKDFDKKEYNDFDDSCILLAGELKNRYYRAGFSDAVTFLIGWRDKEWK